MFKVGHVILLTVVQAMLQARWPDEPAALCLPYVTEASANTLTQRGYKCLGDFVQSARGTRSKNSREQQIGGTQSLNAGHAGDRDSLSRDLKAALAAHEATDCLALIDRLPSVTMSGYAAQARSKRSNNNNNTSDRHANAEDQGSASAGVPLDKSSGDEQTEVAIEVTLQRQSGVATSGRGKDVKAGQRARVYAPRCACPAVSLPCVAHALHRLRQAACHVASGSRSFAAESTPL